MAKIISLTTAPNRFEGTDILALADNGKLYKLRYKKEVDGESTTYHAYWETLPDLPSRTRSR